MSEPINNKTKAAIALSVATAAVAIAQEKAAPADTRKVSFKTGVFGGEMKDVERNVPLDEPPPLALNKDLRVIGKRIPRLDGKLKVSGGARYASDIKLPGMLYAKFISSTVPHARILSIDTSAVEKHPAVRAVHILDKIDGSAQLRDKSQELQSKYPIVRYVGQPIAAIAATSYPAAVEAASLVKIEYEVLPFTVDLDEARMDGSPLVFPGAADSGGTAGGGGGPAGVPQKGNVHGPDNYRGAKEEDIKAAFGASDVVVEGEYHTQVQTHSALETHGFVVDWKDDMLTVYASTQSTLSVRDELAAVFNLPKSKVRVITEYMGGGFGAKFGAGNPGVVATHLSKKTGSPVRLFADRKEEHWAYGNRPDSHQWLKIGATKDGKLKAMEFLHYGTAGVGTGTGSGGPMNNMYECANKRSRELDVFIHAGPGTSMRAPGHPQGCFALEQAMDDLAEKLAIDPVQLRELNDKSEARRMERKVGAEKFEWSKKWRKPNSDKGHIKRGVGFAQSVWYRIINMDAACEVRIGKDGSVEAYSAVQDIGGGIRTVTAQVVAEELGLNTKDITVKIGDTNSPAGPPSGGSLTTGSFTPAVRNAAYKAKLALLNEIAPSMGAKSGNELVLTENKVTNTASGKSVSFKAACAMLAKDQISARADRTPEYGDRPNARVQLGGVQFAEVTVDTETGIIKVDHVVAVHDCARPMNILTLESQVNGGILQGISYALFEDRRMDKFTGMMVNPNFEQYKVLGAKETPRIEAYFIEEYIGRSSTDAGGIGEPSTVPTSAAIANAVYNACGVRMKELPMSPKRVLAALGKYTPSVEMASDNVREAMMQIGGQV